MQPLNILILHGVGKQGTSFASDFCEKLGKILLDAKIDPNFLPICWQETIEPEERRLVERIGLKWRAFRELFVSYGGDALAYQISEDSNSLYRRIHAYIDEEIALLDDSPLIVVSHSLGTVIASNLIWDSEHLESKGAEIHRVSKETSSKLRNLVQFWTLGSPIATWSLRYKDGGTPLQTKAQWFNLYSPNDIIASPLGIINQQYRSMPNLIDKEIKVGNLVTSWNPLSHTQYLEDSGLISYMAKEIVTLFRSK